MKLIEQYNSEGVFPPIKATDFVCYFNVSSTLKEHSKELNLWAEKPETKSYIEILESITEIPTNKLIQILNENTKDEEIWIHEDLINEFARWINQDFEIMCNTIIKDALKQELATEILKTFKLEDNILSLIQKNASLQIKLIKFEEKNDSEKPITTDNVSCEG